MDEEEFIPVVGESAAPDSGPEGVDYERLSEDQQSFIEHVLSGGTFAVRNDRGTYTIWRAGPDPGRDIGPGTDEIQRDSFAWLRSDAFRRGLGLSAKPGRDGGERDSTSRAGTGEISGNRGYRSVIDELKSIQGWHGVINDGPITPFRPDDAGAGEISGNRPNVFDDYEGESGRGGSLPPPRVPLFFGRRSVRQADIEKVVRQTIKEWLDGYLTQPLTAAEWARVVSDRTRRNSDDAGRISAEDRFGLPIQCPKDIRVEHETLRSQGDIYSPVTSARLRHIERHLGRGEYICNCRRMERPQAPTGSDH